MMLRMFLMCFQCLPPVYEVGLVACRQSKSHELNGKSLMKHLIWCQLFVTHIGRLGQLPCTMAAAISSSQCYKALYMAGHATSHLCIWHCLTALDALNHTSRSMTQPLTEQAKRIRSSVPSQHQMWC